MPHDVDASTAVPSPHSLKVVTSRQRTCAAYIARTESRNRATLRASRGCDSRAWKKPGLTENDWPGTSTCACAGAYSCQDVGCSPHDR